MPYAAKAKIEHEFEVDHLNVWVTFRHPMDQTLKPPLALWLLEADDVAVDIVDSAWQDEFTILLTSDALGESPERVLLEYDGPDSNLQTTWGKDWEPWGPILSVDLAAYRRPSFVDRSSSSGWDFSTGNFIKDDALRELDLSSIVPEGAVGVVLCVRALVTSPGKLFAMKKNAAASGHSMSRLTSQVANIVFSGNFIVPVDSSRIIVYSASVATWTWLDVFILGWFV